jgi:hypothetical protein
MSIKTTNKTLGLANAYVAVYDSNLREEIEQEQREVEELGLQIIENAAYVLFSQGYNVDDVISYFTEAKVSTITEDFVNYAEGRVLLESVVVSDAYIEEQFQQLDEIAGLIARGAGLLAKGFGAGQKAAKATQVAARAKNISNIKNAKLADWKKGSLATPMGPAAKNQGVLQKAGNFAKGLMTKAKDVVKKVPGAGTVAKIAKPIGKVAGRALPGVGAALYGADAVSRAKKGDWGGAALSGLGAATSLVPGAGVVGALAPAGIQMATDAMGLTGDKSKKGGGPKVTPAGPPSLKAKQDYAKSKGKYYSSADQKTYKNYNDALAATNSRRGVKTSSAPAAPAASSAAPSGGSGGSRSSGGAAAPSGTKTAPSTAPKASDSKLTPMQQWAKSNPTLAAKVKPGQSGYDDISATRTKPGPNEKQNQTPTTGPTPTADQQKKLNQTGYTPLTSDQESEARKRRMQQTAAATTTKESYDTYDVVLDYLISEGHAESISEAHYVMMQMSPEYIQNIVEGSGVVTGAAKVINKVLKPTNQTPGEEKKAVSGITKGLDVVAKPIKSALSPADNSQKAQQQRVNKYRP